jgi:hypothetical protein
MITIMIFALLAGVLLTYVCVRQDGEYTVKNLMLTFLFTSIFWGPIGGIVGGIVAMSLPAQTEYKCVETRNIAALQDNSSISGSFFLGCGTIKEHIVYYSYVEKNGTYKLEKFELNDVSIKFSDQRPRVEKWRNVPIKGKIINLFAIDSWHSEYIFYVPQGTIKQNFNLDAQ